MTNRSNRDDDERIFKNVVLQNGEMGEYRENRQYPKTEREYLARIIDSSQSKGN
jgi:hypothetical protein